MTKASLITKTWFEHEPLESKNYKHNVFEHQTIQLKAKNDRVNV